MKAFASLDELVSSDGSELGLTEWLTVDQKRVNLFFDTTDGHQWIHADPDCAASGPFGGMIARGLLSPSMLPATLHQLHHASGFAMAINYGLNKFRVSPVPGSLRVRASAVIAACTTLPALRANVVTTLEVEGSDEPAAVIESIVRDVR